MESVGNISQSSSAETALNGNSSLSTSQSGTEFSSLFGEMSSGELIGNIFSTMQQNSLLEESCAWDYDWQDRLAENNEENFADDLDLPEDKDDEDEEKSPRRELKDFESTAKSFEPKTSEVPKATESLAFSQMQSSENLAGTVPEIPEPSVTPEPNASLESSLVEAVEPVSQAAAQTATKDAAVPGRTQGQPQERLFENTGRENTQLRQPGEAGRFAEFESGSSKPGGSSSQFAGLNQSPVQVSKTLNGGMTTAELDQLAKDLRVNQLSLNVYAKNGFLPGSQGSSVAALVQPSVYAEMEALELIGKSVELAGTLEQLSQDAGSAKNASWKIMNGENAEAEPEQQQQQQQQQSGQLPRDELGRALQQLKIAANSIMGRPGTANNLAAGINAASSGAAASSVANVAAESGSSEFESSTLFGLSGNDTAGKLSEMARRQQSAARMMNFGANARQNAEEIANQVMKMAARNLRTLEISLNPEQLGKMKLSFELQGTEAAKVSIASLNPVTRELVGECLGKLREIFAENDMDIEAEIAEYTESGDDSDYTSEQDAAEERQQQGAGAPPMMAGSAEEEDEEDELYADDEEDDDTDAEFGELESLFTEDGTPLPHHRSAGINFVV